MQTETRQNKTNKNICFLNGKKDIYNSVLVRSVMDELAELYPQFECKNFTGIKDIFKADGFVLCGEGSISRGCLALSSVLRKPLVLYSVSQTVKYLRKLSKKSRWVVMSERDSNGSEYYPSPVLLNELTTHKRISRIWSRERLVSKRGSIGILGLELDEKYHRRIALILDLLVEDLDLNIVFVPVLREDSLLEENILSQIKYNANTRLVRISRYLPEEVLGLVSKIDIIITSDLRGVVCAMAANRPFIVLNPDNHLKEFIRDMVQEEIILDLDSLNDDEIYTKIKIAWVHKDAIIEQMQAKISRLKSEASEGIKQLGRKFIKGVN